MVEINKYYYVFSHFIAVKLIVHTYIISPEYLQTWNTTHEKSSSFLQTYTIIIYIIL